MLNEELKIGIMKNQTEIAKLIMKSDNPEALIGDLWKILKESRDKKLKKACKKVIYILKSEGIDVDNLTSKIEDNFDKKFKKDTNVDVKEGMKELYKAFIYIPDSLGNSRVLISFYNRDKANYKLIDIIYNMDEGIKQYGEQKVSKNAIKKIIENESELVEVSPEFVLNRLSNIIESTNTQDKVSEDIKEYIKDSGIEVHPVLSIYRTSIAGIISTEEEKELFSRPELARLMIPDKYVKGYKDEIIQAQNSILIVNNMTPQERISQIINRFIQFYFTPYRLSMYKALLLDIALYLHSLGESIFAKRTIYYAEELVKPMVNINNHPLVKLLIYKSFFINYK